MSREKYTRYPVVDGDKDHVIGFVNFKDIFTEFVQHKAVNKKTVRAICETNYFSYRFYSHS